MSADEPDHRISHQEVSQLRADIARLELQFLNGTLTKEEAEEKLADIQRRFADIESRAGR